MEKTELVYTTFIRTTPEELWAALTNPELAAQYWGGGGNVSDWEKGSEWKHVVEGNPQEIRVAGEVLESEPPKRLVLSWADPNDPADKSRVTFELEPLEDMTSLRVVHDQFKTGSVMATNVAWGWPRVLSSMKSFLETGKGLNIFAGL